MMIDMREREGIVVSINKDCCSTRSFFLVHFLRDVRWSRSQDFNRGRVGCPV